MNRIAVAVLAWVLLGLEAGLMNAMELGHTGIAPSLVTVLAVFVAFDKVLPRHPLIASAMRKLRPADAGAPKPAEVKPAEAKPGVPQLAADRSLSRGMSGADVTALQNRLGLSADGRYGAQTVTAIREFQSRNGLKADGIADAKTIARLNEGDAAPRAATAKNDTKSDTKAGAIPMMVANAQAGAAEALYGLGASLGRRGFAYALARRVIEARDTRELEAEAGLA